MDCHQGQCNVSEAAQKEMEIIAAQVAGICMELDELDGLDGNAVVRRHAWQPTDANGTSLFLHDANKSVMQATSGNGEALGQYAYAPFGEPLDASPARIGFSSELFDASTRLAYYNYRHLAPGLGRWLGRDAIEEEGGVNLYAFINNNAIDLFDLLGLMNGSWTLVRKQKGTETQKCSAENVGETVDDTYFYHKVDYSYKLGMLSKWNNPVTFVLTDVHTVGSALKKAINQGSSGQYLFQIYKKESYKEIKATYRCTCNNNKYSWIRTNKEIMENITEGEEKLSEVKVLDYQEQRNSMTNEEFFEMLHDYLIGVINGI